MKRNPVDSDWKINTSRKTVFRPVNSEQESWKVIEEIAAARRGREWHFEHTIVLVEKEQKKRNEKMRSTSEIRTGSLGGWTTSRLAKSFKKRKKQLVMAAVVDSPINRTNGPNSCPINFGETVRGVGVGETGSFSLVPNGSMIFSVSNSRTTKFRSARQMIERNSWAFEFRARRGDGFFRISRKRMKDPLKLFCFVFSTTIQEHLGTVHGSSGTRWNWTIKTI